MPISSEEFRGLLTRHNLTYARLAERINRSERLVSTWASPTKGGVPDRYEAVVRDALAEAPREERGADAEVRGPLSEYPDYALLDELARRLLRRH